jgi:VanZ family protein
MGLNNKYLWLVVVILYIIGVFYLAMTPKEDVPEDISKAAKWLHFAEFFILAILLYIAFLPFDINIKFLCQVSLIFSIAILTEVVQLWVPGRTCSYVDVMIDLAGAFTLYALFLIMGEGLVMTEWR